MVLVKKITTEDTYFLRQEVLRKNIDLSCKFEGDFDVNTFHLGVYEGRELVCTGTFMNHNYEKLKGSQFQLRGMATLPSARGKGYGKLLLDFSTNELRKLNICFLWCNAREIAVKFYEKNQFKIIGDQFRVHQIGVHYKMYKKIKQ